MKWPKLSKRQAGLLLLVLLLGLTVSAAILDRLNYQYSVLDKEFYFPQEFLPLIRPGLHIEVTDWDFAADGSVSADFRVKDDAGQPLDLDGIFTPGAIRISFILAYIPQGGSTFVNYTSQVQTSPITDDSATQPTADSGGMVTRLAPGEYEYKFGLTLPDDYDPNATHRIAFYAERDLEGFELGAPFDDGAVTFVPSGADVTDNRDVVSNEACARCHDPLRVHGRRGSVEVCVTCHVPGVVDPDTGNSVDFSVLIHKIHRGESLPSVQAGTPYQIIGFRQSVHDFSDVVFPQDHRNCTTCHSDAASQSMFYASRPSRAACGSCHDDVNFVTGEGHPGGAYDNDDACAGCHPAEMEAEFDMSVPGAHVIPENSTQLAGVNAEILEVVNAGPGSFPTIRFRLINDDDSPIDIANMDRVRFQLAGPTTDITFRETLDAAGAMAAGEISPSGESLDGEYVYTSDVALPDDAEGTFAVGFEGRRTAVLNPGTAKEMEIEEQADNPVFYFGVTDAEPVPRRMIVDDAKCEVCHENLALHGGNRHNASGYCQLCHNTQASDEEQRTEENLPPRSIDFRLLIHHIHRGEDLTRDYTIRGFRGSENNFNDVRFPGDLRNCAKCHVDESYFRSAGVEAVPTPREFFSPLQPTTAACLGCHDTIYAAAHAFVSTTMFGESCGTCHGPNRDFAVARAHAR